MRGTRSQELHVLWVRITAVVWGPAVRASFVLASASAFGLLCLLWLLVRCLCSFLEGGSGCHRG